MKIFDRNIYATLFTVVVVMALQGLVNVGTSVDTIKASVFQEVRLPASMFDGTTDMTRKDTQITKYTVEGGVGEPRVTYFPFDDRLLVEVSLPKFLCGSNIQQLSQEQLACSIDKLNQWLWERFSGKTSDVRHWQVRRIDYATHWEVGNDMALYLDAIEKTSLAKYRQRIYETGVDFKNNSRKIALYDKEAQSRERQAWGLLRYEIQNERDACKYMASDWFHCAQTVEQMATTKNARYVLDRFAKALHLETSTQVIIEDEDLRLHFGRRWAQAKTYQQIIKEQGYKGKNLIPRSTYYRYKRELEKMPQVREYLAPLLIGGLA